MGLFYDQNKIDSSILHEYNEFNDITIDSKELKMMQDEFIKIYKENKDSCNFSSVNRISIHIYQDLKHKQEYKGCYLGSIKNYYDDSEHWYGSDRLTIGEKNAVCNVACNSFAKIKSVQNISRRYRLVIFNDIDSAAVDYEDKRKYYRKSIIIAVPKSFHPKLL